MTEPSKPSIPGAAGEEPVREQRDFARSFDSLVEIFAFVRQALGHGDANETDVYAIDMTIEELFTNMVKYNAKGSGRITLEMQCSRNAAVCRLSDPDSDRFDVTAAPDANIGLPAEQRQPGGLGLHLIRRMVDSIDYDYSGRRSTISFRKRFGSSQLVTEPAAATKLADSTNNN
jgi:anti-sigma regulatory factor (Ser/Thr protein kinase)